MSFLALVVPLGLGWNAHALVRLHAIVMSKLAHHGLLELHLLTLLQHPDYLNVIVPSQAYLARVLHHRELMVLLGKKHPGLSCHIHLLLSIFIMYLDIGQLECKHLLRRVVRSVHKICLVGWRFNTTLALTPHNVLIVLSLSAHL